MGFFLQQMQKIYPIEVHKECCISSRKKILTSMIGKKICHK